MHCGREMVLVSLLPLLGPASTIDDPRYLSAVSVLIPAAICGQGCRPPSVGLSTRTKPRPSRSARQTPSTTGRGQQSDSTKTARHSAGSQLGRDSGSTGQNRTTIGRQRSAATAPVSKLAITSLTSTDRPARSRIQPITRQTIIARSLCSFRASLTCCDIGTTGLPPIGLRHQTATLTPGRHSADNRVSKGCPVRGLRCRRLTPAEPPPVVAGAGGVGRGNPSNLIRVVPA